MKVLFLASGSRRGVFGAVVQNQLNSLGSQAIDFEQYVVTGGLKGYLKTVLTLRIYCRKRRIDIIHAHYSLCGFAAALSFTELPVVCSLMGSDMVYPRSLKLIRFFAKHFWAHTIVKSDAMLRVLVGIGTVTLIPNGVDIEMFKPVNGAFSDFRFDRTVKNVVFIGDANRPEKNLSLAQKACDLIKDQGISLREVSNVDRREIPSIIKSADVLLLTSFREGSPNVVKEAMACNVPVVATKVGDIEFLFEGVRGYYTAEFDPNDVAAKIILAIENKGSYNGRQVIIQKALDSKSIAKRLVELYKTVVNDG